jgi:hypothetical protein
MADETVTKEPLLLHSSAEWEAQQPKKPWPHWLTAPTLTSIDSYYPAGVILDHKEEEVNPQYPPLRQELLNHLGKNPSDVDVPREKLLTSSEEWQPGTLDTYICDICLGSGSSPLLTGQLHIEEYHEPLEVYEVKPEGTLKAFFCTACNGTGSPPIPLGEFEG